MQEVVIHAREERQPARLRAAERLVHLRPARGVAGLLFVQLLIKAALPDEFRVRPLLDELPLVEHIHQVGHRRPRKPVRDADRGPPLRQFGKGFKDICLRARVQGAGRLVQNEDARVLKDGAGNR